MHILLEGSKEKATLVNWKQAEIIATKESKRAFYINIFDISSQEKLNLKNQKENLTFLNKITKVWTTQLSHQQMKLFTSNKVQYKKIVCQSSSTILWYVHHYSQVLQSHHHLGHASQKFDVSSRSLLNSRILWARNYKEHHMYKSNVKEENF